MRSIEDIKQLGIVGAGGAGFPTHIKLQSRPEFVILNAAECEPLLHKDKVLLEHHADAVFQGMQTAMAITGAPTGLVGIKVKHTALIQALKKIAPPSIQIVPIGDFYPAGDEVTLIHQTTGRIVQPGALPSSVGCLVMNVETAYNMVQDMPVVDKYLTVAGEVRQPLTVKVPIGTSYMDVLSHFEPTHRKVRVRSGGLMMGTLENDLNTVVTKTTGGLILLPADHYCIETYERYASPETTDRMAKASCDQCSFCTEYCPRYLLGHPVRPEIAMRNRMFTRSDMDLHHNGNAFCCECNLCTFYSCPESLDPKGATVMEKRMAQQKEKWEGLPVKEHPMLNYRKVPTKKLKQRLDVLRYRDEGPLADFEINPDVVRIPLKQHIGAPANPKVSTGNQVRRYDLIAEASAEVSANIHASIDGRVSEVNEMEIIIQRQS